MAPEAIITALIGIIGTLVTAIGYLWRLHLGDDDKRDAERNSREAALIAERDDWKHRWEGADARLNRIATAFTRAFRKPAPE